MQFEEMRIFDANLHSRDVLGAAQLSTTLVEPRLRRLLQRKFAIPLPYQLVYKIALNA
jgi:hypothetical protein